MIRSILAVGGVLFFVAMFLYLMVNPSIIMVLAKEGTGMILKILGQFFSRLAGLL